MARDDDHDGARLEIDCDDERCTTLARRSIALAGLAFLVGSATSASTIWARPFDGTSAALPVFAQRPDVRRPSEAAARRIGDAKRLSGLTWDELSQVMSTTRRTLHLWANGRPISASNEARLSRLVGVLQTINRGTGRRTREALLAPLPNGTVPLDLLVRGKFDEVAAALGRGWPTPVRGTARLSADARASRQPPSPIALFDAAQDPIGTAEQVPLPGKAVRRPTSRA